MTDDMAEARSLGVTGTPGFFVNGRFLNGAKPFEEFERVIHEELTRLNVPVPAKPASTERWMTERSWTWIRAGCVLVLAVRASCYRPRRRTAPTRGQACPRAAHQWRQSTGVELPESSPYGVQGAD